MELHATVPHAPDDPFQMTVREPAPLPTPCILLRCGRDLESIETSKFLHVMHCEIEHLRGSDSVSASWQMRNTPRSGRSCSSCSGGRPMAVSPSSRLRRALGTRCREQHGRRMPPEPSPGGSCQLRRLRRQRGCPPGSVVALRAGLGSGRPTANGGGPRGGARYLVCSSFAGGGRGGAARPLHG